MNRETIEELVHNGLMNRSEAERLVYLAVVGKNALYREDEDDFLSRDETWNRLEKEDEEIIMRAYQYLSSKIAVE